MLWTRFRVELIVVAPSLGITAAAQRISCLRGLEFELVQAIELVMITISSFLL